VIVVEVEPGVRFKSEYVLKGAIKFPKYLIRFITTGLASQAHLSPLGGIENRKSSIINPNSTTS